MAQGSAVKSTKWRYAVEAGLAYFAVVFSSGFLLGASRALVVAPAFGERAAVFLELPIILTISWRSSKWLTSRFNIAAQPMPRLAMGGVAFCLLMVSEIFVSIFGFGRTFAEHFQAYRNLTELIGLAGQLAFAIIPAVQLATMYRMCRAPVD